MTIQETILHLVKTQSREAELIHHWGTGPLWADIANPQAATPEWTDKDLRAAIGNLLDASPEYPKPPVTAQDWVDCIGSL